MGQVGHQNVENGGQKKPLKTKHFYNFFFPSNLHLLDKPSQRLGPGHHVDVLLCVHDPYLLPQLRDDGTRPPAMLQGQILQTEPVFNPNVVLGICCQHIYSSKQTPNSKTHKECLIRAPKPTECCPLLQLIP